KYETPQLLYDAVIAVIADDLHPRKILDLGAGTGLAGALFKDIAHPLIGVDVSARMIQVAEQKGIYDALVLADIHDALRIHRHNELIIAADVLTYLGNLSPLFDLVQQALTPQGLFAFSIEIAPRANKTYTLQTTIRYAHAREYIQDLAKAHGFDIITESKVTLRRQRNEGLPGMLYVLQLR
ncbi:MAG: methyltransferase domain-containing protein, partial [Pseudomonadota bacterium]|nr:methyltransferase domain-containing protein [Pseudomonadota bacterium]